MSCQTCKFFATSEYYAEHLGFCLLEFPVWFYKEVNIVQYESTKTVRKDDECSFHNLGEV